MHRVGEAEGARKNLRFDLPLQLLPASLVLAVNRCDGVNQKPRGYIRKSPFRFKVQIGTYGPLCNYCQQILTYTYECLLLELLSLVIQIFTARPPANLSVDPPLQQAPP